VVGKAKVCPIVFGIKKTDLVGPLASFQATAFDKVEVRQLLTTINNAAFKEVAVAEKTLDASFNKWWPDFEQTVQAISAAQPPTSAPRRDDRELLEEAVSNTRTLLTRPLQVFAPSREMEALIRALQRDKEPDATGDRAEREFGAWPVEGLTPKSE
jgi:hypothetical protein